MKARLRWLSARSPPAKPIADKLRTNHHSHGQEISVLASNSKARLRSRAFRASDSGECTECIQPHPFLPLRHTRAPQDLLSTSVKTRTEPHSKPFHQGLPSSAVFTLPKLPLSPPLEWIPRLMIRPGTSRPKCTMIWPGIPGRSKHTTEKYPTALLQSRVSTIHS